MLVALLWLAAAAAGARAAGQDAPVFDAIRRLEAAEAASPRDASIQTDLALNFFLLGQRNLFHAAIARALELESGSAQAYYLAGRFALEADQDPKAAAGFLAKALQLTPDSFKAHYYLGISLRQLGRFPEAREEFQKAARLSPYGWPSRALAELELELGRPAAALEPARKAIELEPQSAENLVVAGKVYQALAQREKAIPVLQQAARLEPLWPQPHFLLGNLYMAQPETRPEGARELELFRQLESRERPGSPMAAPVPQPSQPQAGSRAELDAFGRMLQASDSLAVIRAGEDFLSRFPGSEFRERVLEAEFQAFRERNDYTPAKAVASNILAINPQNAGVLGGLALMIAEADDRPAFATAETYAADAIAATRSTPRPDRMSRAAFRNWQGDLLASAHAARGLLALRRHDPDAAIRSLREAIECRPAASGSDYLRLGEAFVMQSEAGRAREAFLRAESLGPGVVTEAARRQMALLDIPAPDSFQRARAFEKEGRLKEAAAAYELVVRQNPRLAEAYHNLGLVYYRLSEYRKSADCLRSALKLKPGLAGSRLFLGLSLFRLGEFKDSTVELQAALASDPRNREIHLFLIRDQIALGRFRPEAASQGLRLFPQDPELNYTVGLACLERIREIARAANESGPDSAEFVWLSLRRAEERGQSSTAERYRLRASSFPEPALIREYDLLAGMLKHSFDTVLALAPASQAAYSIRGYLHESRQETDAALEQYRQAGDHFAAGRLLAQNARLQEAESEFQAALAEDPQNDRAKADLGRLYLQQDEAVKARAILSQIVVRYPRDAYAWADLGKAEAKLGAAYRAEQALRKALELDPSLNQIHYQLGMLYRQQGNDALAREELQLFRNNRKSNP